MRLTLDAELKKMVGKNVSVEMSDGALYTGVLEAFDPTSLALVLSNAEKEKGQKYFRVVLGGTHIRAILLPKAFVELKKLAERLERIFPNMVKYNEEAGVVIVLDKVRVDERGVIEGTGMVAERVQKVYEEFMKGAGTEP
ncbi:MAG TPA: Lsm family RNA-binding protein [Thermoproteota archaeon]|nr:Lsm family RNA-binding protein [Thermoproteota archaeon]